MKLRSKKGFTLIELIIVIAILGIIALIAVPNLAGIRQRSQVSADKRTAEQIGKAVRIWATDVDAGTRVIPTTAVMYDNAWRTAESGEVAGKGDLLAAERTGDTIPLLGLCETYISKGYTAKSLAGGAGKFYVSSFSGTGENYSNQKIYIGIADDSSSSGDLKSTEFETPAEGLTATYDGTKAAWAYIEK